MRHVHSWRTDVDGVQFCSVCGELCPICDGKASRCTNCGGTDRQWWEQRQQRLRAEEEDAL